MGKLICFPILYENAWGITCGKAFEIEDNKNMNPMDNLTFCKDDPVVDTIVKKFLTRSTQGMIKYKTSMHDNKAPTLEWINHAQEEAMDFILYLERLKQDIKDMNNKLNAGHYFEE